MKHTATKHTDGYVQAQRTFRSQLLRDTDWAVAAGSPFTADEQAQINAYRQALRDCTAGKTGYLIIVPRPDLFPLPKKFSSFIQDLYPTWQPHHPT